MTEQSNNPEDLKSAKASPNDRNTEALDSAEKTTPITAKNPLIEKIREDLLKQIDDDTIKIPTLPEIAVEVRRVCSGDDASVQEVCSVVERDPGIAARVIKVANSPLFRGAQAIENLNLATSRLGLRYTANYVTGIAMQQLYKPKHPLIEKLMREVWANSAMIAASATLAARLDTRFNKEQATLAGLTHQIGMLPLLLYAESNQAIQENLDLLPQILQQTHGELGWMILNKWDFSPDIAEVPLLYRLPNRQSEAACYSDIISVAYAQCVNAEQIQVDWLQPNEETNAHRRLHIIGSSDPSEQQQLVEHIEMTAAAFAA